MRFIYLLPIALAGAAAFALLPLPYAYYELLRWAICAGAAYMAYEAVATRRMVGWAIGLGILAVVFNPFESLALGRGGWAIVDVIAAIFLVCYSIVRYGRDKKEGAIIADTIMGAAMKQEAASAKEPDTLGSQSRQVGTAGTNTAGSTPLVVDAPASHADQLRALMVKLGLDPAQHDREDFAVDLSLAALHRIIYFANQNREQPLDRPIWMGVLVMIVTDAITQKLNVNWEIVALSVRTGYFIDASEVMSGELDENKIALQALFSEKVQPYMAASEKYGPQTMELGTLVLQWLRDNDEAPLRLIAEKLDDFKASIFEATKELGLHARAQRS